MVNKYFTTLDSDHLLFRTLKEDNPRCWQFIKQNIKPGCFYVDIRKDNSINVYYNGGSLLKINTPAGKLCCKIHEFYLGGKGSRYVEYNPINLPKEAEAMKERSRSRYGDNSESGIKARLINAPGATYIDSEFAYPEKTDEGYQTIRIDLVKIENDKIIFVELKRIQDGRLLTDEYEQGKPEILTQMKQYHEFVRKHKAEITEYYKALYHIKRELGILPESLAGVEHIDHYELSEQVELYIEPYDKLNPQRIRRIDAIKKILDKHHIRHNLHNL